MVADILSHSLTLLGQPSTKFYFLNFQTHEEGITMTIRIKNYFKFYEHMCVCMYDHSPYFLKYFV